MDVAHDHVIILQVEEWNQVERDQLLCISHNKNYVAPKSKSEVEIKANWGRARKQFGPTATEITISAARNPGVDVKDPFMLSSLHDAV